PLKSLFGEEATPEIFLSGSEHEWDITRADGTAAHLLGSSIDLPHEEGWLLIIVDLTARKAAERAIEHLAFHDPTTGAPNRRFLIDRLARVLARADGEAFLTGVLFCDIDRFKQINDTYGHRAGDAVLQMTAVRLASV